MPLARARFDEPSERRVRVSRPPLRSFERRTFFLAEIVSGSYVIDFATGTLPAVRVLTRGVRSFGGGGVEKSSERKKKLGGREEKVLWSDSFCSPQMPALLHDELDRERLSTCMWPSVSVLLAKKLVASGRDPVLMSARKRGKRGYGEGGRGIGVQRRRWRSRANGAGRRHPAF